jgi:hypothetical protein
MEAWIRQRRSEVAAGPLHPPTGTGWRGSPAGTLTPGQLQTKHAGMPGWQSGCATVPRGTTGRATANTTPRKNASSGCGPTASARSSGKAPSPPTRPPSSTLQSQVGGKEERGAALRASERHGTAHPSPVVPIGGRWSPPHSSELGGFSQTSQHRLKVVLIHAQFDAPIEENGPSGLG